MTELIAALRATARRLERGADYRWTHMGSCNCGHLAQTLTRLPKEEIHRLALERAGDWGQQARDYCPSSGYPMDHVLAVLFDAGLTRDDVWHLERLSDPEVLRRLPVGERHLDHRRRDDVVLYLRTWAARLEDRCRASAASPPSTRGIIERADRRAEPVAAGARLDAAAARAARPDGWR